MKIQEVSEKSGLSQATIRDYEVAGMIGVVQRTSGGLRIFTEAHLQRLVLIRRLRAFDIPVSDIRQIFHDPTMDEGREAVMQQLRQASIDAKQLLREVESLQASPLAST